MGERGGHNLHTGEKLEQRQLPKTRIFLLTTPSRAICGEPSRAKHELEQPHINIGLLMKVSPEKRVITNNMNVLM